MTRLFSSMCLCLLILFLNPTQAGSKSVFKKQDEQDLYNLHQQQINQHKINQLNQISLKQSTEDDGSEADGEVPDEIEPQSKADEKFILADAFLQGFRSDEVFPSAMNCTRYAHSSVEVYNKTRQEWKNVSSPAHDNGTEQVFDTTWWISYSVAPMSSYCFLTNLEVLGLYQLKMKQFGGMSGYYPAWIQNVLGNVITVNSLMTKIEDAKLINDTVAVYYWYGRLANVIFIFDPQVEEVFEEEDIPEFDGFESLMKTNPLFEQLRKILKAEDNLVGNQTVDSSTFDNISPAMPATLGLIDIPWYFSRGFMQYAFVKTSPNATLCDGNITVAVNRTKEIERDLFNVSNETMAANAVEFQELLETAYPISWNCYCARSEIKYRWGYYMKELTDPDNMGYNVIHKTASLYDAFYYLTVQWAIDRSTLTTTNALRNYWYKLGGYVGLITRIIMTPPPSSLVDSSEAWPPVNPTVDPSQDQEEFLHQTEDLQ